MKYNKKIGIIKTQNSDKKFNLIDIEFPKEITGFSYMVLKNDTSQHILFPNGIENSTYKLGRSHEADIKILDLSVSRVHAMIIYKNNNFYIEDNDSKFGTLILLNGKQEISLGKQLSVQLEKSVLTFAVKSKHIL